MTAQFIDKSAENVDNQVYFKLTVNDGKKVEALYDSNGWVDTKSSRFHFGLSRAEGSNKISFVLAGDKGEIVNRETIADVAETLIDTPVLAGVGVNASAVEYSSIKVEGNGPTTGFKFGELEF